MSKVRDPENDLPRDGLGRLLRGGSDIWDQTQAWVLLEADYFEPLTMRLNPFDARSGITVSADGYSATSTLDSREVIGYRSIADPVGDIFLSGVVTQAGAVMLGIQDADKPRPFITISVASGNSFSFGTDQAVGVRLVSLSVSDVVDVAVRYSTKRIWYRVNGGAWNGDPVAGTGGFNFPSLSLWKAGKLVPFVGLGSGAGLAINVGQQAFTYDPPSGYVSFETPPVSGTILTPDAGTVEVVGLAPSVSAGASLTPDAGAVNVAGLSPVVSAAVSLTPDPGDVTASGSAPTLAAAATASAALGAVTVAGLAPTVTAAASLTPDVGAVTVSGLASDVSAAVSTAPAAGAVSVAGMTPDVSAAVTASPDAGGVTVDGLAPDVTLVADTVLTPDVGSVTIDGIAPTVAAAATASPATGSVSVEGLSPTVEANATASPAAGAVAVTGLAPSVSAGVQTAPDVGAVTVAGLLSAVAIEIAAQPDTGGVTVSGFAPSVSAAHSLTPDVGSISVDGLTSTLEIGDTQAGRRKKIVAMLHPGQLI